jgi:hypothetical protein
MIVAPRRLRGHIASLAYHLKTRNPAYRELIKAVWGKETRHVLTAHWSPQMVRRMLARADIPVPEFNGPVTVYRAVERVPARRAAAGLCWTASRDTAIAQAMAADAIEPRILQGTVDPGEIIYWGNSRGEQEIVLRRSLRNAVVELVSPSREALRPVASHQR